MKVYFIPVAPPFIKRRREAGALFINTDLFKLKHKPENKQWMGQDTSHVNI